MRELQYTGQQLVAELVLVLVSMTMGHYLHMSFCVGETGSTAETKIFLQYSGGIGKEGFNVEMRW